MTSAVDRHRERLRASPGDSRAFEALEQELFCAADWIELIELYTDRLADPGLVSSPRERARLGFRRAQIQFERLHDSDGAVKSLGTSLRDDPQHRPALSLLRRIESKRGRFEVALQVAEVESELSLPPADRCVLLCEMAEIWLDRLGEPQQALEGYTSALASAPDDDAALAGTARALERLGRFADAAEIWERLIAHRRGPDRAVAQVALAKLTDGPLARAGRVRSLFRAALDEDPHNPDAIAAVLDHANSRGQWPVVADLLERQFEMHDDASTRAVIAARLGRLQRDHVSNPTAARTWFARAADNGSREPEVFEALADYERENGDDAALRAALEGALDLRGETAPVSLLLEIASLYSDSGEEERALQVLERAVTLSPGDGLALGALSETLVHLGRYEELVDLLEQRASTASADPVAYAAALAELGVLHEERLQDQSAARHAYERAFVAHPSAHDVGAVLERLYRKAEDWEALRDLLEVSGRVGTSHERARALGFLGNLQLEHFCAPDAAERAFGAALELDLGNSAAHRGVQRLAYDRGDEDALVAAYEREAAVTDDPARIGFLACEISRTFQDRADPQAALPWLLRWSDALPDDVSAQAACADGFERLGRFSDLAVTLSGLDALLSPETRPANRRRLGAAHAAAGDGEASIVAYRSALSIAPRDEQALKALAIQLEAAGRFEELAPVQRQLADVVPGPERVVCLDSLARLLEERLGDFTGTIDVLQRLIAEVDPPADAYPRLERLLELTARFDELTDVLASRATRLGDSDEATALELRRAQVLWDRLGRTDATIAVLRSLWRRNPGSTEVRDELERSLRDAYRPAELADFLAQLIRTTPERDWRDRCAFERAVLLAEELDDGSAAEAEFRRIAATAADPTLRRLATARREALLERRGDWLALRVHLEEALRNGGSPLDLHERIGRLCRDHLGDADGAIAHFRSSATLAPMRADLWRALASLCEAAGHAGVLVEALEAELALVPDPEREMALRIRAAHHCRGDLCDTERAASHYECILALDPSNAAATDFLAERCLRCRDDRGALRLLESRLNALDGALRGDDGAWADQRASLRIRMASLLAEALDDVDGAVAILEPALGELGPQPIVAAPLADLYARADLWEERAALCERVAENCSGDSERAVWLVRLGDSLRDTGRIREAASAYQRALSDRPGDCEVQAVLCDLYRRLREYDPLARLLEAELSHVAGSDEIPLRTELAELLERRLDRPDQALVHLIRVLQLEPGHSGALDAALAVARRLERTDTIDTLLAAALATPAPPHIRAAWWGQRGALLAERANASGPAIHAYREALRLDPARGADRTALRALLAKRGDWPAVLDCLDREIDTGAERLERLELAAKIAWENLAPDAALPWLERLQAEQPEDRETARRISETHRRGSRPEALLRSLAREVRLADAPHSLHRESAEILENQLGSPARAVAALELAFASAADDVETQQQLDRLYRCTGRHRERAALLEILIESAPAESQVSLRCDAASLYADRLGMPDLAVAHLLHAVSASRGAPIAGELLRALGRSLRAVGRPEAWARCAEEELGTLDPKSPVLSDRRRELRRELAACYEHELGRLDSALRHLRALVDLKWSESHGAGAEERAAIEAALLRLLRQRHCWIELADRIDQHLAHCPDDVDEWRELAQLRAERLRSPVSAAAAYRALLALRPNDVDAMRGLRRASELVDDWKGVAATLEHELEHAPDLATFERAALLRRLGDVCWNRLGSTTRARRAFSSALELDPTDFSALRGLQQLLAAMENWPGALDLYECEIERLCDDQPERRQQACLRAGEIARDHTREPDRALRAYELAAEIANLAAPQRAELAELYWSRGDIEAFVASYSIWCNDASVSASAADHLRLAEALEGLGRTTEAAASAERALFCDATPVRAWNAVGRLREACGDTAGAADALARAAALLPDEEAAIRLHRAAVLREAADPVGSLALLRAAVGRDPANAAICAALATSCARREEFADAAEFAGRALAMSEAAGGLSRDVRVATALAGARAARWCGDDEAAVRLYAHVLAVEAEHSDALSEYGETLADLGDMPGTRAALEARLALDTEDEFRALHMTLLGSALAATGEPELARDRFEAAIALDPTFDRAHRELVKLLEATDQNEAGISCLERWARATGNPSARAEHLLRAATWELRREGAPEFAERHLRAAIAANPKLAPAWETLATLLWNQQQPEEAFAVATAGLGAVSGSDAQGPLALIRARAIERRGDRRAAAEAFADAAESGPASVEAALSHARLLRGLGEWQPAAQALQRFADDPRNGEAAGLADVLQQLARLLAGPLENVEGAIAAYRLAVEVDPARTEPRAALAEFLSHRPEDRGESLLQLDAVLAADPTHAASLRVVLRMARERGDDAAVATGVAILHALGIPTAHGPAAESSGVSPSFAGDAHLDDPLAEKLRQIARVAARDLANALQTSNERPATSTGSPATRFRAAVMEAEAALTAPALIPLDEHRLRDVLTLTAALALEPTQVQGDGQLVNALSGAIRRRTRRHLQRLLDGVSLAEIAATDFAAWRREIRALAARVALETTGCDLRTALRVLIDEDSNHSIQDAPETLDLAPFVTANPAARSLLRRVVHGWLQRS